MTSIRRFDHPKPHIWLESGLYHYRAAGLTVYELTVERAWRKWQRRAEAAAPKFVPTPRRWLELSHGGC